MWQQIEIHISFKYKSVPYFRILPILKCFHDCRCYRKIYKVPFIWKHQHSRPQISRKTGVVEMLNHMKRLQLTASRHRGSTVKCWFDGKSWNQLRITCTRRMGWAGMGIGENQTQGLESRCSSLKENAALCHAISCYAISCKFQLAQFCQIWGCPLQCLSS